MIGIIGGYSAISRIDLFTQDRDIIRRIQAQPYPIPFNPKHTDNDIVADQDPLINPSGQDKHFTKLRVNLNVYNQSP